MPQAVAGRRRRTPRTPRQGRSPARAGLWLAAALVLALLVPCLAQARGTLYRYLDENGVMHFTNVPSNDRYRPIVRKSRTRPRGGEIRRHSLPRESRYDSIIVSAAREEGVEPALVKAVIAAESNFDAAAVSRKGAQGLMQLMPQTAESLGVRNPFIPDENVGGGTRYLRVMLDRYGDVSRALAAYNAGPTAVDRYRGIPPYRETRDYVDRVLTYYRGYHGEIGSGTRIGK